MVISESQARACGLEVSLKARKYQNELKNLSTFNRLQSDII